MGSDDGDSDRLLTRSQRQMAYAKGKRAEGKCGYSGCHEPSPDAFYCPDCKERVKQTREARYARLGGGKAA